MLRFRRDRLFVGIDTEAINFVRIGGLLPTQPVDHFTLSLDASKGDDGIFEVLSSALCSSRCSGTTATVTLADQYFRYFIAERPEGTRNAQELEMAASLRFEDLYGSPAEEWIVRLDVQPFARSLLACAFRKALFDKLRCAFEAAGIPLTSLLPFAVSELNNIPRANATKDAHLIVVNTSGIWYGMRLEGHWRRTFWNAFHDSTAGAIRKIITQESMRAGDSKLSDSLPIIVSGRMCNATIRDAITELPARINVAESWAAQSHEWSETYRLALSRMWPRCA